MYLCSAYAGMCGNLLLDPKNIIILSAISVASYALIDPHIAAANSVRMVLYSAQR